MIVYLDGENVVFQLMDVLHRTRRVSSREELLKVDLTDLIRQMVGHRDLTIKYYATTLHAPKDPDPELGQRVQDIADWTAKWTAHLTQQGIVVVDAGVLKTREGVTCRNCGHQETIFIEKGVDVRLAVDLVVDSQDDKNLIIWSSDADLLPAIEVVKKRGARVKNLAHEGSLNWTLARACEEWQTYTNGQLVKMFDKNTVLDLIKEEREAQEE